MALSAQTGYIMPQEYEIYCVRLGGQGKHTIKQWNNTLNWKSHNALRPVLCGDNLFNMKRLPRNSLSSQSFGKYRLLNQNNQETVHIQTQASEIQKVALINSRQHIQKPMLRERTDTAWFSRFLHPSRKWSGFIFINPGASTGLTDS